jgi:hypothetical protein
MEGSDTHRRNGRLWHQEEQFMSPLLMQGGKQKKKIKKQVTVYRIELRTPYKIFWSTDNRKVWINIVKMEFMPQIARPLVNATWVKLEGCFERGLKIILWHTGITIKIEGLCNTSKKI